MSESERPERRGFTIGLLISLACLAAVFLIVRPAELMEALKTARLDMLSLSIPGIIAYAVLRALRWRYLLKNAPGFTRTFHVQNIGYLLNTILPFRMGDLARVVIIGRSGEVRYALAASSVLVERVLDLAFFVALLPFTLPAVESLPGWMRSAAITSAILAMGTIVILAIAARNSRVAGRITEAALHRLPFLDESLWSRRLEDLLESLESFTHLRQGLILLAYSVLLWIPILHSYHSALLAVGIPATWRMSGFVICAAAFSVAAPSAPGQLGVFHAGVIAALTALAQPGAEAAGFAFLYHALNITTMSLLGAIGLAQTGLTIRGVTASVRSPKLNKRE